MKKLLAVAAAAGAVLLTATAAFAQPAGGEAAFGQLVRQQVATCRASASQSGTHGIGPCVSAWVHEHSPSTSARQNEATGQESPEPDGAGAGKSGTAQAGPAFTPPGWAKHPGKHHT